MGGTRGARRRWGRGEPRPWGRVCRWGGPVAAARIRVPPRSATPSRGGEWERGCGGGGAAQARRQEEIPLAHPLGWRRGRPPRPCRSRPAGRKRGGSPHFVCPPMVPRPRVTRGPASAGTLGATAGGPESAVSRHTRNSWAGPSPSQGAGAGLWCRARSLRQPGAGRARVRTHGRDVPPRRGHRFPWPRRGVALPGNLLGAGQQPGVHPHPEPPEPGRASVTGRLGCLPAQCHRPVGARVLAGRALSRPRGCLPAPSRAGCAPGPSTPCAGTRAAWSGWGSWKSGSGPCPAPGVAPPAGGSRGPAGSRGGGALPGLGAVGPAGSADFWRRGWGGQRMFPTAADGGGAVLAGQGGPASALPRPGRRCRVCCADKGGLFQRSVHSGEGPPGRLCRGVCVPARAGRAVPPAARGAPRPAPERGRGSRYSVRQFDL